MLRSPLMQNQRSGMKPPTPNPDLSNRLRKLPSSMTHWVNLLTTEEIHKYLNILKSLLSRNCGQEIN